MSSVISQLSQSQISSLMNSEQAMLNQPIVVWETQIKSDQALLSAWGQISGAMSSLQSAVSAISDPTTFNNRSAASSNTSVASTTVQRNAPAGSYTLSSVKMAQSQELYSANYASASAAMGTGSGSLTFSFGSGGTETVTVGSGSMTLSGVTQAINQVSGGQLSASIVGGTGGERLVITGNTTGSSQSFSVTGAGALSALHYSTGSGSASMTLARAARNATLNVNGVPISSATNSLTSAIPSATVTLAGSGSTTVSVSTDAAPMSLAVSAVVSKLNSAVSTIQKETAYNAGSSSGSGGSSKQPNGPLLGNYSATDLANELLGSISGLTTTALSGADIGITIGSNGVVSFNSGTFASAYQSNPSGVETLVSQLYTQVNAITTATVGSANGAGSGTIGAQQNSLNSDIKSLKAQVNQQSDFVKAQMQIYADQFTQLETSQSNLAVTSNYLSLLSGSGSSNGTGG